MLVPVLSGPLDSTDSTDTDKETVTAADTDTDTGTGTDSAKKAVVASAKGLGLVIGGNTLTLATRIVEFQKTRYCWSGGGGGASGGDGAWSRLDYPTRCTLNDYKTSTGYKTEAQLELGRVKVTCVCVCVCVVDGRES